MYCACLFIFVHMCKFGTYCGCFLWQLLPLAEHERPWVAEREVSWRCYVLFLMCRLCLLLRLVVAAFEVFLFTLLVWLWLQD